MRRLLALAFLFFICNPLAESALDAPAEDARLAAYFKEFLEEEMKQRPLDATRLGDHRYDHLLDDVSAKSRAAGKQRILKTLADFPQRVAYQKLSRAGRIDFEIWQQNLKKDLWLAENPRPFEEDPRVYNDYITESVYVLLTQSTLPL